MNCLDVVFFLILLMNNIEQLAGMQDIVALLKLEGLLIKRKSKVQLDFWVSEMKCSWNSV
jgi:hypothetical protein